MEKYGNTLCKIAQALHSWLNTPTPVKNNQNHPSIWKRLKSIKKSKEFEKTDEVLSDIIKYWEMELAFNYNSRCQISPPVVRHFIIRQKEGKKSLKLENIGSLWKKLIIWKSYWNIGTTSAVLRKRIFMLIYSKVPKHVTRNDTSRYHSSSRSLVSVTEKCQKP